jgi:hypothetical protein
LPNIAALSDAQCEQLRAFVAKGGSLVATHETSLYDEQGRRGERTSGWPICLASIGPARRKAPMLNSYIRLEHEALPGHTSCLLGLKMRRA